LSPAHPGGKVEVISSGKREIDTETAMAPMRKQMPAQAKSGIDATRTLGPCLRKAIAASRIKKPVLLRRNLGNLIGNRFITDIADIA
jgi:hypothetical protein